MILRTTVILLMFLLLNGCGDAVDDRPAPATRTTANTAPKFTSDHAARFADLALDCVDQEYPNKIAHTMAADADAGTPLSLHPAFFGCFDWHSSVHGHWLLARFARLYPAHHSAQAARDVLDRHLTPERIALEAAYLETEGRSSWERPYGLAWLLQLAAELHDWNDPDAQRWSNALEPLEDACVESFLNWLPKLAYPIRTGEHSQTAFAFGMALDYARMRGRDELAALIEITSLRLYREDRDADLAFEPSGQDFLSPILAEADLMRRVMEAPYFADWLARFLPGLPRNGSTAWLPLAVVTDRSDGKLAHLDGLNLSRAWMLEGIISGLPQDDVRLPALRAAAEEHAASAVASLTGEHYEGGHWLGSFAMYLVTRRGLEIDE